MRAELTLSSQEVQAMVEANISATWPCIPGHKWEAEWRSLYNEIVVTAVPVPRSEQVADEEVDHG